MQRLEKSKKKEKETAAVCHKVNTNVGVTNSLNFQKLILSLQFVESHVIELFCPVPHPNADLGTLVRIPFRPKTNEECESLRRLL